MATGLLLDDQPDEVRAAAAGRARAGGPGDVLGGGPGGRRRADGPIGDSVANAGDHVDPPGRTPRQRAQRPYSSSLWVSVTKRWRRATSP